MGREQNRTSRPVGGDTRFEGAGVGPQVRVDRYENGSQVMVTETPIGPMAPCIRGGGVTEVDYDSKDGVCRCSYGICPVDGRNVVLTDPVSVRIETKH